MRRFLHQAFGVLSAVIVVSAGLSMPALLALPGTALAAQEVSKVTLSPSSPTSGASVTIAYTLSADATKFFMDITSPDGTVVRILVDGAPRKGGANREIWDGNDYKKYPVLAGDFAVTFSVAWADGSISRTIERFKIVGTAAPAPVVPASPVAASAAPAAPAAPVTAPANPVRPADVAAERNRVEEIVGTSYATAFRRRASDDEMKYWLAQPAGDPRLVSLDTLIGNHRTFLREFEPERLATVERVYRAIFRTAPEGDVLDTWLLSVKALGHTAQELHRLMLVTESYAEVFGRAPSFDEKTYWVAQPSSDLRVQTIETMRANHQDFLKADDGERAGTIRRAVRAALGREAIDADMQAWDAAVRDAYSYQDVLKRLTVAESFSRARGRDPDAGEWVDWLNRTDSYPRNEGNGRLPTVTTLLSWHRAELKVGGRSQVYKGGRYEEIQVLVLRAEEAALAGARGTVALGVWVQAALDSNWLYDDVVRVIVVFESYVQALGREPTLAEMGYWQSVSRGDARVATLQSLVNNHREWLGSAIVSYHPDAIAALSPRAVITAGVNRLSRDQLRALTTEQLQYFDPGVDDFLVGLLTDAQLGDLTPDQVRGLSPAVFRRSIYGNRIAALHPGHIVVLTIEQVKALDANQILAAGVANFTLNQVSAMDPLTIKAVGVASFQPVQLAQLTADKVRVIGPSSLTSEQVALLPPETVVAIGAAQLSPSQLAAFFSTQATIVAAGGGNIVAAGGGNIVAAGGGNLIGGDGASIVAAGGGNVIGNDGGSIVAAGGGNIVAAGGGNVRGNGGSIVAAGGGNFIGVGVGSLIGGDGASIVAAGGGNILSSAGGGLVAINAPQAQQLASQLSAVQRASIVAAGGGNLLGGPFPPPN